MSLWVSGCTRDHLQLMCICSWPPQELREERKKKKKSRRPRRTKTRQYSIVVSGIYLSWKTGELMCNRNETWSRIT